MMSCSWLREVSNDVNLPALPKDASRKLLCEVESEIKRVVQLSFKLQKRAKKTTMTVEDVNLALTVLNANNVYGLVGSERGRPSQCQHQAALQKVSTTTVAVTEHHNRVDLASYACRQLPQYPLHPEAHFHWLAVQGIQPSVPQNPEVVVYDASADTTGLPREVAYFYTKLTQLVLAASPADSSGLEVSAACDLLRADAGLQPLVGYLCRFVFVQIRRNLKHTHVLQALLQVIQGLVLNPSLNLETCLHQLLPSLLSCIVGAKIGDPTCNSSYYLHSVQFPVSRHHAWSELQAVHVRQFGACVVQSVLTRYGHTFPDLLPRVCKTYLQAATTPVTTGGAGALQPLTGATAVRYGGIVGLGMLGETAISEVLLPNINAILLSSVVSPAHTTAEKEEAGVEPTPTPQLIGRKGGMSSAARSRVVGKSADGGDTSDSSEEVLLVSIINWYIRRSMRAAPSLDFLNRLRNKIVVPVADQEQKHVADDDHKRRRVETGAGAGGNSGGGGEFRGWDQFADSNIEKFVPHYVSSSVTLHYCSGLFI